MKQRRRRRRRNPAAAPAKASWKLTTKGYMLVGGVLGLGAILLWMRHRASAAPATATAPTGRIVPASANMPRGVISAAKKTATGDVFSSRGGLGSLG